MVNGLTAHPFADAARATGRGWLAPDAGPAVRAAHWGIRGTSALSIPSPWDPRTARRDLRGWTKTDSRSPARPCR